MLRQAVRAHNGAEGASLLSGSPMAAVIDENAGACFLLCLELSPLRAFLPAVDAERDWEVVNAGGISYASYRVVRLMEALADREPPVPKVAV